MIPEKAYKAYYEGETLEDFLDLVSTRYNVDKIGVSCTTISSTSPVVQMKFGVDEDCVNAWNQYKPNFFSGTVANFEYTYPEIYQGFRAVLVYTTEGQTKYKSSSCNNLSMETAPNVTFATNSDNTPCFTFEELSKLPPDSQTYDVRQTSSEPPTSQFANFGLKVSNSGDTIEILDGSNSKTLTWNQSIYGYLCNKCGPNGGEQFFGLTSGMTGIDIDNNKLQLEI
jgi:hypothetical protein